MQNILQILEEKAKEEITAILQKKDSELLVLKQDFQKKAEEKKQKELLGLKQGLEASLASQGQAMVFQNQLALQTEKRKALKDIYQEAKKQLFSLPEEKLNDFFVEMIKLLPEKQGLLIAGKRAEPILKRILAENKLSGFKLEEGKFSEDDGFIFQTSKAKIDFRFSALLNELEEKIEPELARILFT
ncbi:hypothetical protein FJ208_01620 [Candidatus Gribaldobacteria bacterium]|nr:hypothetical protein [Candidatus Gribaldobacteria bacterium]